jgi:hypothetical protein
MAGSTISTLANLARPNVSQQVVDLLFRKTDLFDLLRASGRVSQGVGPSPFKWNVVTTANASAEVFVEGQAPGTVGRQATAQASLDAFYVRATYGITGHAMDNAGKDGFYTDPVALEQMLAESDLFKKLEDELVGSTQDRGIAAIIDATGTYASLAQGTYSVWASEENGSVGTLGIDDFEDLYEELTSASVSSVPRGASPTHILTTPNQITNYVRSIGPAASSGGTFRINPGMGFDAGFTRPGMSSFNGLPIVPVRGLTNTELYMVDINDLELLIHRDLKMDEIVGNPEERKVAISTAVALKVAHRNWHGKMTGITA